MTPVPYAIPTTRIQALASAAVLHNQGLSPHAAVSSSDTSGSGRRRGRYP
jgi:hypothetical protein